MGLLTVLLLSGDQGLIDLVRDLLPDGELVTVSCLGEYALALSSFWLVIDPRWVKQCCLDRLATWRGSLDPRQVAFLPFAAAPEILLALPRIVPGIVASPENLRAVIASRSPASRARVAWANRDQVLGRKDYPWDVHGFVRLAQDRARNGLTVSQTAAALRMSERTLRRKSARWIGFPPEIVLDLARVVSVAAQLRYRNDPLEMIATEHRFAHAPAMSRAFLEFVGLRPGAYRKLHRIHPVAGNGIDLADNSNRPRSRSTVDSRHHGLTPPEDSAS